MIQDHVASLDLAKQLYEAGIVVESEFVWVTKYPKNEKETFNDVVSRMGRPDSKTENSEIIPAPLSSELGELLPDIIEPCQYLTCIVQTTMMSGRNGWKVYYKDNEEIPTIWADTEANARAKCLLYLKEKGLL